jgi:hypothetical protein
MAHGVGLEFNHQYSQKKKVKPNEETLSSPTQERTTQKKRLNSSTAQQRMKGLS